MPPSPSPDPFSWFKILGTLGLLGFLGTLISTILQVLNAKRIERNRSADARSLESVRDELATKLQDRRAVDAEALERVKAELTKLSHLHTTAEEKRASIAGDVLVAILRMVDALELSTSLVSFPAPTDFPDGMSADARRQEEGRREVSARHALVHEYEDEFRRAWHLAEVHLQESVPELFDRIHTLTIEIRVAQQMHAGNLELYGFFDEGYGKEPKRKLAEIRQEAKTLLRPLAQLAASPLPPAT